MTLNQNDKNTVMNVILQFLSFSSLGLEKGFVFGLIKTFFKNPFPEMCDHPILLDDLEMRLIFKEMVEKKVVTSMMKNKLRFYSVALEGVKMLNWDLNYDSPISQLFDEGFGHKGSMPNLMQGLTKSDVKPIFNEDGSMEAIGIDLSRVPFFLVPVVESQVRERLKQVARIVKRQEKNKAPRVKAMYKNPPRNHKGGDKTKCVKKDMHHQ